MRELASRLNVSLDFVIYKTPAEVADAAEKNTWDVAVLAIEPARAEKIAFSPAMTEIEATYVVHKESEIQSAAQVDSSGRILAPDKAGYELYLRRTLRSATLIRSDSFQASIDIFNEGRAEALAGLRPALLESMHKIRVGRTARRRVHDRESRAWHSPRPARGGGVPQDFRRRDDTSGFVARSIRRHDVQGLSAVK